MTAAKIVLLSLVGILVGCGNNQIQGGQRTLQVLNGSEYAILPGSTLQSDASTVSGTGKIVFRNPLVNPDNNFDLKFRLAQSGSICLVGQADQNLQNGVQLCFARTQSDKLKVELKLDADIQDKSTDFAAFSASDEVSVSIDIHGHGHLAVWMGESENEYAFSGRKGTLWGIELANATLTKAVQGAPKDNH